MSNCKKYPLQKSYFEKLVLIYFVFLSSYFRVEKRLNSFYSLLVKESLDREDVEQMERENMKDCHEILQMFRNSKGVTKYLVTRAVVQLSVGILLCALLIWIYLYHLMGPEIKCEALGMHHSCIVPLSSFYYAVLMGSLLASHGFLACCIYKLIWIAFVERMSPFAKLMRRKRSYIDKCIKNENSSKDVRPVFTKILPCSGGTAEPFFDVYHSKESPDFGLLVTMLATRNGISEGLRILTLFDKEYQKLWKPGAIAIYHGSVPNNFSYSKESECKGSEVATKNDVEHQEKNAVTIVWTDAPIAPFIDSYCTNCKQKQYKKQYSIYLNIYNLQHLFKNYFKAYFFLALGPLRMEYTVEIVPNKIAEDPLRSHMYHSDKSKLFFQFDEGDFDKNYNTANPSKDHNEINEYSETFFSPILNECDLKSLKKDDKSGKEEKIDLKIVISTEINGRTIAQTSEKIPPPPRPNNYE